MRKKVAIVTGGTRGIGLGISQQLAVDRYDLIIGFNSNEKAANETKQNLEAEHGCLLYTSPSPRDVP